MISTATLSQPVTESIQFNEFRVLGPIEGDMILYDYRQMPMPAYHNFPNNVIKTHTIQQPVS